MYDNVAIICLIMIILILIYNLKDYNKMKKDINTLYREIAFLSESK